MELNMWIIAFITFCVMLIENITILIKVIKDDNPLFLFNTLTMCVSICMIITSIIQICILA